MSNLAITPEGLEIATTYLGCMSIEETAKSLGMTHHEVSTYLDKKEVKRYIDNVFLEQGYLHRFKLASLLDDIIESKIQEAAESGVYTNKDLLDVLALVHKIRMDNAKVDSAPNTQVNVQNNYGNNLSSLIDKVISGK